MYMKVLRQLQVYCFVQALDEVATLSGVMSVGDDYLPSSVREECERIVPNIDGVKPAEAADSYLFLKAHHREPTS